MTRGLREGAYRVIKQKEFDLITLGSKSFHADGAAVHRLDAAVREALLYVAENKAQVNGWFAKSAKLDLQTIDESSRLNANYSVRALGDVNLSIGARFRAELNREAEFLFAQKALARRPELGPYLR